MPICVREGASYQAAFERGLAEAKGMGAEAACFGDIDIERNRRWEEDRCTAAGLIPCFPLWQRGWEEIVRELIRLGYRCLIKSVDRTVLPAELLGTPVSEASILAMRAAGVDVCGENGEYHTLAVDGPVFQKPLSFRMGDRIELGDHAVIKIE